MSTIIRDNRSNKGAMNGSRQRFLKRYRKHIKGAVSDALDKGSIESMGEGGIDISVPKRDLNEPFITHDPKTGRKEMVHPGNKEFQAGDRQKKQGGGGSGAGDGKASNQGEGEDDFTFHLTEEEFYNFLFEGLELPNFKKAGQQDSEQTKSERAGIVSEGTPNNLDLVRSVKKRMGRSFAANGKRNRELVDLWEQKLSILDQYEGTALAAFENAIEGLKMTNGIKVQKLTRFIDDHVAQFNDAARNDYYGDTAEIDEQIVALSKKRGTKVPWNEIDLKYRNFEQQPIKISKAVMFCVMDVSGSMDQQTKENAKLFYLLLYKFLKKHYDQTDVVFIRHHTEAKEVDEQEFFYSQETGGTIVSSGLAKMLEIMKERYPQDQWNIYGAQASDGDNWEDDSSYCVPLIEEIISKSQGYWYTEITRRDPQELWRTYEAIADAHPDKFWMGKIEDRKDIPTVFREFFKQRGESMSSVAAFKPPHLAA